MDPAHASSMRRRFALANTSPIESAASWIRRSSPRIASRAWQSQLPRGTWAHPRARLELAHSARRYGRSESELIADLGGVPHLGAVLVPELVIWGGGLKTRGRAVQHVHCPGVRDRPHVLEWDANGQVGEPVVVEVPGAKRGAEFIAHLGYVPHLGAVLVPELVIGGGGLKSPGRAVQHVHRPGVRD